ncbi:MAG: hypothetical protein FD168_228 [Desulfobulbaceae bacterium]|nr:MAG: hypothetical protein FD168_228 [Desulfobulbaceae bacterium]
MNPGIRALLLLLITCFSLTLDPASSRAEAAAKVPAPLSPWVDWVLHGHEEEQLCSPSFNDASNLHCDWPARLVIQVGEQGGTFRQQWLVQHKRWLQLPGDTDHWPVDVKVNGQPALVMNRDGGPQIKVDRGSHEISGRFQWISLPESLPIPPHSGLISLVLNGQTVEFPNFDRDGRLWFQARQGQPEKMENSLSLQAFRLVDDAIPAQMTTLLKLDIAGTAREIVTGPLFAPDRMTPLSVTAGLPVKLEADGRLRIQVRPGQWEVTVISRFIGPLNSYQWTRPDDPFWPAEEILAFQAHPDLRSVEISGISAIDPQLTSMPKEWRTSPAYRMLPGESMQIKETRRGAALPPPDQLGLQRKLWLRFDGAGYTIQDTISGQKNNGWRLEMAPPLTLGRVMVNGQEQFITKRAGSDKAGVELREGQLQLTADSTLTASHSALFSTLPATGWDHDFQQVSATLNLPPGWRLLNATGIDSIAASWVNRWSLLDFFVVIIFTLAIARLYRQPTLSIVAFCSFVLSYHEAGAPRWVWLAILAGVALLRYLPTGKFRQIIKGYQAITILSLILFAIPFAINQLRVGIYPQLEKPWHSMADLTARKAPAVAAAPAPLADRMAQNAEVLEESDAVKSVQSKEMIAGSMAPPAPKLKGRAASSGYSSQSQAQQYDPKMLQQTGPGLPAWQWTAIPMQWSGPVERNQQITLTLIGPKTNLVLAFLRVLLMGLLAAGMFNISWRPGKGWTLPVWKTLFVLPFLLGFLPGPSPCQAGDIPSPEMFEELRSRLLEKADCFPHCANIPEMAVTITPETLSLNLQVDSQVDSAIPLPGNGSHWLPQQVFLDDKPATALFRSEEQLWILVPAGHHAIRLSGNLPRQNSIQLPLPLHPNHTTSTAHGWIVEGIENGVADSQLQFKRVLNKEDRAGQPLEAGILPPFVLIERTLLLGLTWKVETRISRMSPEGSAVVLDIPLLPGESVVTEGVRVQDGRAKVALDAKAYELRWESVLEKGEQLLLSHADTSQWTEIWRVDVSPIYHLESEGVPVILHQTGRRWLPTWHPWPGEQVKLLISRPEGIAGQTLTIDQSRLQVRPGSRATETTLTFTIRSSQGGQHTITLPADAQVQKAAINGAPQQLRQDGGKLTIPITPGKQDISVEWRQPSGINTFYRTPIIDLGSDSVNSAIDMTLPANRWPLFLGGPLLGPAILYWSTLLVVALMALVIGKTGLTPLRFHQLFLLGIGMSMSNLFSCLLVVGWLIAVQWRIRLKADKGKYAFNLIQVGLGFLTVSALIALVWAISQGLLGHPDMNIRGNGSNSSLLRWYQDVSGRTLPQGWLFSIPMLAYRLAMLAWALWISITLLGLLKWGWKILNEPMLWDSTPRKKIEGKTQEGK